MFVEARIFELPEFKALGSQPRAVAALTRAPLVIAHRGDSAHRPENTLASFASALEVGATLVELDVQLTARRPRGRHPRPDPRPHHHGPGRRAAADPRRGARASPPATRSASASACAGERVPTLAEALALLRGRARVLVEIKTESVTDDAEGGVEARAVAEIRRAGMAEQVALISFDHRAIVRLRHLAPEMTRGRLFGRTSADEVLADAARGRLRARDAAQEPARATRSSSASTRRA